MELIKHIDWKFLKVKKVLKIILDDLEEHDECVYMIWKNNKIVAKMVSYRKYHG